MSRNASGSVWKMWTAFYRNTSPEADGQQWATSWMVFFEICVPIANLVRGIMCRGLCNRPRRPLARSRSCGRASPCTPAPCQTPPLRSGARAVRWCDKQISYTYYCGCIPLKWRLSDEIYIQFVILGRSVSNACFLVQKGINWHTV